MCVCDFYCVYMGTFLFFSWVPIAVFRCSKWSTKPKSWGIMTLKRKQSRIKKIPLIPSLVESYSIITLTHLFKRSTNFNFSTANLSQASPITVFPTSVNHITFMIINCSMYKSKPLFSPPLPSLAHFWDPRDEVSSILEIIYLEGLVAYHCSECFMEPLFDDE